MGLNLDKRMDDDVKFARGRVLCVCVFGVFFGVVAFISEWIIIFFTQFRVVSFGRVFT